MVGGLQCVERGVGHRFQFRFVVAKQKQVGVGNLMDKAKIMAGHEQAARRFFLQSGDVIELSAQCNSTFAPTPVHYLKPSVMVRYSLSNRDNPRFYAGLGGQWIHPYRNLAPDRVLLTVSLGVWFL